VRETEPETKSNLLLFYEKVRKKVTESNPGKREKSIIISSNSSHPLNKIFLYAYGKLSGNTYTGTEIQNLG